MARINRSSILTAAGFNPHSSIFASTRHRLFIGNEAEGPKRNNRTLFVQGDKVPFEAIIAALTEHNVNYVYFGAGFLGSYNESVVGKVIDLGYDVTVESADITLIEKIGPQREFAWMVPISMAGVPIAESQQILSEMYARVAALAHVDPKAQLRQRVFIKTDTGRFVFVYELTSGLGNSEQPVFINSYEAYVGDVEVWSPEGERKKTLDSDPDDENDDEDEDDDLPRKSKSKPKREEF